MAAETETTPTPIDVTPAPVGVTDYGAGAEGSGSDSVCSLAGELLLTEEEQDLLADSCDEEDKNGKRTLLLSPSVRH